MGPDPRFLALARVLCIGVSQEFIIDLAYKLQETAETFFKDRVFLMIPYIENTNPHHTQRFYNSTGIVAIVCNCGFATTYSYLGSLSTELGQLHFNRMHEEHLRRLL
jgi:hypothetical protein